MRLSFQPSLENIESAKPINKQWEFLNYEGLPDYVKKIKSLDELLILCPTTVVTTYYSTSNLHSNSSIDYDILLDELYNHIINNDKSGQEWDLNSIFINTVYQTKSTNCYISMRDTFSDPINNTAELIYKVVEQNLKRKGKRVYRDAIRFSCCWLAKHLHRMLKNKHNGIKYHRANKTYIKVNKQNKLDGLDDLKTPTCRNLINCIDILAEEGYGYTFKGFKNNLFDKTMLSLFLPTSKLIDFLTPETIIEEFVEQKLVNLVEVRDKNKQTILEEFYRQEWIVDIKRSESILEKHNQLILDTKITIDQVPLDGLQIMRIHNDSDINKGGRLYDNGTWTTMKSSHRKGVVISGYKTKTLDISHLHPSLLYAKKGVDMKDFNPYGGIDLPIDLTLVNEFKEYYSLENYDPLRNLAKLALLIMINANNDYEAIQAIDRKLSLNFSLGGTVFEDEMKFIGLPRKCGKLVIDQVKKHNHLISEFFCTGIAKDLMRLDSDIILETLDVLVDKKICTLPLHDSITFADIYLDEAERALRNAYLKVVGSCLNYKVTLA
jgi:hypothetical protein